MSKKDFLSREAAFTITTQAPVLKLLDLFARNYLAPKWQDPSLEQLASVYAYVAELALLDFERLASSSLAMADYRDAEGVPGDELLEARLCEKFKSLTAKMRSEKGTR